MMQEIYEKFENPDALRNDYGGERTVQRSSSLCMSSAAEHET